MREEQNTWLLSDKMIRRTTVPGVYILQQMHRKTKSSQEKAYNQLLIFSWFSLVFSHVFKCLCL